MMHKNGKWYSTHSKRFETKLARKSQSKLKLYKITVIQIIWAPCEMKKIYRKLARTLVKHNRHCRSKFENLRGCCDILESSRESA